MIVCLGWGSLIWSPRSLPASGAWNPDGPQLPVEFSRVASDKRLTLAITPGAPPITVLWARLAVPTLDSAIAALAEREGCSRESIGFWSEAQSSGHPHSAEIARWARDREAKAVVWTALRPGVPGQRGTPLGSAEVLAHLAGLQGAERERAEEYIRKAPRQTSTPFRSQIERRFGWIPA